MTASIKTTNQYAEFCACMWVPFSWRSIYHFCLVCKDIHETKIRTKKKVLTSGRLGWWWYLKIIKVKALEMNKSPISDRACQWHVFSIHSRSPKDTDELLEKKKISNLTPPEKVSYFMVPMKVFNLFSTQGV